MKNDEKKNLVHKGLRRRILERQSEGPDGEGREDLTEGHRLSCRGEGHIRGGVLHAIADLHTSHRKHNLDAVAEKAEICHKIFF